MLSKRGVAPSSGGTDRGAFPGTKSTALPRAALASLLLAAPGPALAAMPLRDAGSLAITCTVRGLPAREAAAARTSLCARVAAAAARGAPYPIAGAPVSTGPQLDVEVVVTRGRAQGQRIAIAAHLVRPGQSDTAPRLSATSQPVAFDDAAAVEAAINTALVVLPWRRERRDRPPSPPRAH